MRAFRVFAVLASAALSSANPLQNVVNNEAHVVPPPHDPGARGEHSIETPKSEKKASAGPPRRLGVGKRHQWSDDEATMVPHMKSVIGKAKKESKGSSQNEERVGGRGKRARPVMDEVEDEEKSKVAETTNSTRNKKSKDKKSESSSDDKEQQKDKLSKPTPTPTPYPTSVDSDFPSVAPSTVKINPGARPVFEEPTISPVNSTSVLTDGPVVAPVMVLDAPVATPVTVVTSTGTPLVNPAPTAVPIVPTMQTSSPTGAPNINIIAASEQTLFTDTVKARSLYLRVEGEFDPVREEAAFFTVLEETFNPYSRAYISYILNEFEIAVLFLNALTQQTANADETSIVTSWCEVNVTFQLASDNEQDVAGFTVDRASQFVKSFFMDSHKTRLIKLMTETGVAVSDLEALEELPAELTTILAGAGPIQTDQDERAPPAVEAEADETDLSKASYGVAIASGGVIFLALGAMALMHRQQKDRVSNIHGRSAFISGEVDGHSANSGKALAFVSGNRRVDVKPAALHVRNRRVRESRRQRAMSSNNTVSTYFTTETALSNTTQADTPGSDEKVSLSDTTNISGAGTRLVDLAVSSALTCLDGEESVGALNEAYPEFEMYQSNGSPPPSPVWSIDQYSNASPYSVEEDYVAERRRWHDEANELALIALPDTNSVYSMSQHSRSSESHVEEHNKRHRMDEV